MIRGKPSCDPQAAMRSTIATACRAQMYVGSLGLVDGELEMTFNDGIASQLGLAAYRWQSTDGPAARTRQARQQEVLCRFWPPAGSRIRTVAELRGDAAAGLRELVGLCRISLGDHLFTFDFASARITARKGLLRDIVVCRRFLLKEFPGLNGFAAALRGAGGFSG